MVFCLTDRLLDSAVTSGGGVEYFRGMFKDVTSEASTRNFRDDGDTVTEMALGTPDDGDEGRSVTESGGNSSGGINPDLWAGRLRGRSHK